MIKTIRIIPVFVLLVLLTVTASPVFAQDNVVEVEVRSRGFSFTPNEIEVNLGDTVRVTYVNGGGRHDWVLDEFDVATAVISGGQSETVEFVADQAGTFEFYCSVPGHRQAGMVGTLIVRD